MSTYPLSVMVLISLVALSAGVIGFLAQRAGQRAVGFWLIAWGSLLSSVTVIVLMPIRPELQPVSFMFSSLTSPLMAMGAYAYSKRKEPAWLIPFAVSIGILRLAFFQLGLEDGARSLSGLFEPPFAFLAAYLTVTRSGGADFKPSKAERFLALTFCCFGVVELADAVGRQMGVLSGVFWTMWLVVSLPLFTQQISIQLSKIARQELDFATQTQATTERLNSLLRSANDLLMEIDATGIITFLSATKETILPGANSQLIGKALLDLAQPNAAFGLFNTLKQNGRISEEDITEYLRTPQPPLPVEINGEMRYFESKIDFYRTLHGELRIVGGIRDVTTRVRQEEIIKKSTIRLSRAEAIARVGSWEFDAKAKVFHCSPQLTELYGMPESADPIPAIRFTDCVTPEDREDLDATWMKFARSPGRFEQVFRIRRVRDGALRYLRVLGEVEQVSHDEPLRTFGATIDITEQRELEERLRRGQERFERFAESNIVGCFFVDPDGAIRDANSAFLDMIGYSVGDLPLHWDALTPASDRAEEARALREILTGATSQPYEKSLLHKSGHQATALIAGAGLGSDQAIVIAVDLREQKIAEQYIERYQRELEETVALRTNELLESRNRLEETERLAAVGTLAAGVAHQINNPIGAILNSAEYALLCREDEDANQIFERVLNDNLTEAKRCAQIVRSMLQFSRDQPAERWIEDLRSVAQRAHRSILPYAQDCRAHVGLTLPKDAVFARISPIEIEQAIVNALRNSIESSDRGAAVSLSLEHRDKKARIEVVDNGRGVAQEEVEHLFDPFYSTRTNVGGTGLGLSVAHGIVKAHAGEIEVESVLGSGTRLLITLPTMDADPDLN